MTISNMVEVNKSVNAAIRLDAISKTYGRGRGAVTALDSVSLDFPERSFTAVMGPSGSGKSTLIQCAAGLDKPSQRSVWLGETELSKLKEPKLTKARRKEIGFVFQAFNLLPSLTAKQNIQLPLKLAGESVDGRWFDEVVVSIGLAQLLNRYPAELSGGQQQRVAIARALVSRRHDHAIGHRRRLGDLPDRRSFRALRRDFGDRHDGDGDLRANARVFAVAVDRRHQPANHVDGAE
jgi:putative ABC transport system ATP-binding protein